MLQVHTHRTSGRSCCAASSFFFHVCTFWPAGLQQVGTECGVQMVAATAPAVPARRLRVPPLHTKHRRQQACERPSPQPVQCSACANLRAKVSAACDFACTVLWRTVFSASPPSCQDTRAVASTAVAQRESSRCTACAKSSITAKLLPKVALTRCCRPRRPCKRKSAAPFLHEKHGQLCRRPSTVPCWKDDGQGSKTDGSSCWTPTCAALGSASLPPGASEGLPALLPACAGVAAKVRGLPSP